MHLRIWRGGGHVEAFLKDAVPPLLLEGAVVPHHHMALRWMTMHAGGQGSENLLTGLLGGRVANLSSHT